jgi:hypothetical protein
VTSPEIKTPTNLASGEPGAWANSADFGAPAKRVTVVWLMPPGFNIEVFEREKVTKARNGFRAQPEMGLRLCVGEIEQREQEGTLCCDLHVQYRPAKSEAVLSWLNPKRKN